jgi:drug/metabolite transporter (DMT)-like permease
MKPAQVARWGKVRAKGLGRFLLVTGLLGYGLPMFAIMTFVVDRRAHSLPEVALAAAIWLVAGLLFGIVLWSFMERRYGQATDPRKGG